MPQMRVAASVLIGLSLVGAGCNSRLLRPPVTIYADAGHLTVPAVIGEERRAYPSTLLSFFPSIVALHPGDEVNFQVRDNGEPHSVALGSLVDEAASAVDQLPPGTDPAAAEELPEMQRIPHVFPAVVESEQPRVNASAAERCFMETGAPPVSTTGGAPPCPERSQPAFDGTYAFYSGGVLWEGEPFRLSLSRDIAPATYRYMCLVHRAAMMGTLDVRAPEVDRPRVADVRQQGSDEQREVASTLEPAARRAVELDQPPLLAGTGPSGRISGILTSFVPEDVTVSRGESVGWRLFGTHSISFNPSRRAREGVLVRDGGAVTLNMDAWGAVGSRAPPPVAVSSTPSQRTASVEGGTWSGEGTFSSGILRGTPPAEVTYQMSFAAPGVYDYVCLVHPSMRGRIEVV